MFYSVVDQASIEIPLWLLTGMLLCIKSDPGAQKQSKVTGVYL